MILIDVLNARKVLSQVATQKLNGNLSYGIMKFIKNSSDDEDFFMTELKKIINEYAKKDSDGHFVQDTNGNILVSEESIEQCNAQIRALHQTEVQIPWQFNCQDICSADCFSPQELLILDLFIKEAI